jgi:hypothetical protein
MRLHASFRNLVATVAAFLMEHRRPKQQFDIARG